MKISKNIPGVIAFTLLLSLTAPLAQAAPPRSLGDLNKIKSARSFPFSAQSGNKIFFFRATEAEGSEPWVTDGTVAGTQLLKDIVPGPDSSLPLAFAPATFGGQPGAYFVARTPAEGAELWVTDGTSAGTKLVKDINPGSDDGISGSGGFISFPQIVTDPSQSYAFFAASDGVNGNELWATNDGTAASTNMLVNINPGSAGSDPGDFKYYPQFPLLLFSAYTTTGGREPFYTTGLTVGSLGDINPGALSSNPNNFTLADATPITIIFTADDGTHGREVFRTAGGGSYAHFRSYARF